LEEETDPEKAQKLSEMIAILREVRLSRLCSGNILMIDGTQVCKEMYVGSCWMGSDYRFDHLGLSSGETVVVIALLSSGIFSALTHVSR